MAYIYSISFDIGLDKMDGLKVGASLELTLSYLRALLPSEAGFVSARAMATVKPDKGGKIGLMFQSVWEHWEDLLAHRDSSLAEEKILRESQPHVELGEMRVCVYEEVA